MPAVQRQSNVWAGILLSTLAAGVILTWLVPADQDVRRLLATTLQLAARAALVSVPLAGLLAVLLVRTDVPGRGLAIWLLASLLFIPLYLHMAGWDAGFGKLGWFSLQYGSLRRPLLTGLPAAAWVHAMAAVPWATMLIAVGLRMTDPQLEELALLSAGRWSVLWRVTFRQALPAVAAAAVWVLVSTSGEMTVTNVYLVPTFTEQLYLGFSLGAELEQSAIRVVPGILLVTLLVTAMFWALGHLTPPPDQAIDRPRLIYRLGRLRPLLAAVLLMVVAAMVAVPVGNLVYKAGSFSLPEAGGGVTRGWSWWKFIEIVVQSPWAFRREFGWTLLIGALAASCAVVLGGPLAWLARRATGGSLFVLGLVAFGLALPGPLVGMGLVSIWGGAENQLARWLYDQTVAAPVVALLARCLPLAVLVLWFALRTVPLELLEAAATEGAGPVSRFWHMIAAARPQAFLAAWLVALAAAMGDLSTSILVVPPGIDTVSRRVFGLIHAGVDDQVAGICLTSGFGFALLAAAFLWLWRGVRE